MIADAPDREKGRALYFGRARWSTPVQEKRGRREALAHRSPIEAPSSRRGRLRPKVRKRIPRAIPDDQRDELFEQMRCTRNRTLDTADAAELAELLQFLRDWLAVDGEDLLGHEAIS